jgi:2'-5' RNA ligase
METKRCFLAVPIKDEGIIARIQELQKKISLSCADIKFVEKENFHYNFKFFGSITEDELNKVTSIAEKVLRPKKQFEIEIGGVGTFPTADFIRVVWIGLKKGEKEMLSLAKELDEAFSTVGIAKEERPFQAHLTLGRLRSTANIDALKKKINEEKNTDIGRMPVDEVVLYQSMLGRNGPTYVELKKFRLSK